MRRRTAAALLVGCLVFLVGGIAVAVTAPGASYAWQHNMLSDLGDATCQTWDGRWNCSPRYAWFNASWIVAGVLLVLAAVLLRRRWGVVLAVGVGGAGLGLVLLGAYPSDGWHDLHMAGAVLALPGPGLGLLFSAIRPRGVRTVSPRHLRGALSAVGLAACLAHLLPPSDLAPRGAAEVVTLAALVVFLAVEAMPLVVEAAGRAPTAVTRSTEHHR